MAKSFDVDNPVPAASAYSSTPPPTPPASGRPRRRVRWGRLLLTLVVLAGFSFGAWLASPWSARNVLILGVDDGGERSDTLILAAASPASGLWLLSIPRDTRVSIPGRQGLDKIGHAHAYGGPELASRTVSALIGAPVHGYVEFDFRAFAAAVDALGGVEIDVEQRMSYRDPYQNLKIDLRPGLQTLRGGEALQYVRFRDGTGDIGRIQRQQKFVAALLDQAFSPSRIWRLPAAFLAASRYVRADFAGGSVPALIVAALRSRVGGLRTASVPGVPVQAGGLWYWAPDMPRLKGMLAGHVAGR